MNFIRIFFFHFYSFFFTKVLFLIFWLYFEKYNGKLSFPKYRNLIHPLYSFFSFLSSSPLNFPYRNFIPRSKIDITASLCNLPLSQAYSILVRVFLCVDKDDNLPRDELSLFLFQIIKIPRAVFFIHVIGFSSVNLSLLRVRPHVVVRNVIKRSHYFTLRNDISFPRLLHVISPLDRGASFRRASRTTQARATRYAQ